MKIKVLFFATLKDQTNTSHVDLEVKAGSKIVELQEQLSQLFPGAAVLISRALVSINQNYAFPEDEIPEGAEVAFFPPVSGGSLTICRITSDVLDLNELVAKITQNSTGAVCVFTGIVRGETKRGDAHETAALEYEAYIPMAEAKMNQVADEIRARWPSVEGIVIVQRIGRLKPGTPTVLIACAAAHRDTGVFEAARYGIDRLKEIVPVWKKEIGPRGDVWVEGEYLPKHGD